MFGVTQSMVQLLSVFVIILNILYLLVYTRWTTHHCINSLDLYNSLTFFISDLLRAVPIIIDFLQDLEANICLTRDGRHITP
jgi:hypothetical protein